MTYVEMLEYIDRQIPTTSDNTLLGNLRMLRAFLDEELVEMSPRSHTAALAYDSRVVNIFDQRCRDMFYSLLGIDSRNFEETNGIKKL